MRVTWLLLGLALWVSCVLCAPPSVSAQGSDAEARALFNAGEVAYSEGRYESALDYFRRAYDLSGRALLLYNIGSAAEHVRQDAAALEAFERYLRDTPEDAPHRVAVAARVEFLRRTLAESAAAEAAEAAAAEAAEAEASAEVVETRDEVVTPRPEEGPGAAPWVVMGVGAAVAVAGAVLVGVGYADSATVSGATDGTTWASISGAYERAPVLQGVGFALLGVGVATAVAGIVWGATGSSSSAGEDVAASLWLTPDGGGAVIGGSF